jgi:hypothetical protein
MLRGGIDWGSGKRTSVGGDSFYLDTERRIRRADVLKSSCRNLARGPRPTFLDATEDDHYFRRNPLTKL